jgi:alpha-glucosidase
MALGRQMAALLLSLKGSVCLYQGEELGLPQTDMLFEELTDPPGIRFWPEYKGRDGCRTPIPWDGAEPGAGFTTGKPWLPIKAPQAAHNAAAEEADPESLLQFYRRMLTWRKAQDALVDGDIAFFRTAEPVLAFRRTGESGGVICVFNLSPEALTVSVSGLAAGVQPEGVSERAALKGRRLTLGPNGFAFLRDEGGVAKVGYRRRAGQKASPASPEATEQFAVAERRMEQKA